MGGEVDDLLGEDFEGPPVLLGGAAQPLVPRIGVQYDVRGSQRLQFAQVRADLRDRSVARPPARVRQRGAGEEIWMRGQSSGSGRSSSALSWRSAGSAACRSQSAFGHRGCQASPKRAARRTAGRLLPPIHTGGAGSRRGIGALWTEVKETVSPRKVARPSLQSWCSAARYSSVTRPRVVKGTFRAS